MVLAARSHLDQRLQLHATPPTTCVTSSFKKREQVRSSQAWLYHGKTVPMVRGRPGFRALRRLTAIPDGMARSQGESEPVWTSSRNTIAVRELREDPGTFSSFNFGQFLFTGAFQKQGRTSALCIPLSTVPVLKSLGNMENNKQETKICLCESMLVPPNKTYEPVFIPQL